MNVNEPYITQNNILKMKMGRIIITMLFFLPNKKSIKLTKHIHNMKFTLLNDIIFISMYLKIIIQQLYL